MPSKSSYFILETASDLLKILGVVVVVGGLAVTVAIATNSDSNQATRNWAALATFIGSFAGGVLIAAAGAAIDVFLANHRALVGD